MTSVCIPAAHSPRQQRLLQLIVDHRMYFLRVAQRILHNEHDAEDTLQNAFFSAWKAVEGFREDAAWKTWFTGIVINKALSLLRSQKVRTAISIEDDPTCIADFEVERAAQMPTPERALLDHEARQILHRRIDRLPTNTRTVLRMRYFEDLSIEDIAQHRGATSRSIQSHLMRGRKLLRQPRRTAVGV